MASMTNPFSGLLPLLMDVDGNDLPPGGSLAALMTSGDSPASYGSADTQPWPFFLAPTAATNPAPRRYSVDDALASWLRGLAPQLQPMASGNADTMPDDGLQLAAASGGRAPQGQAPVARPAPAAPPGSTSALEYFFGPAAPDQPRNALDPMGLTGFLGSASLSPPSPDWYMDPSRGADQKFVDFFNDNYPLAVRALAPYNFNPAFAVATAGLETDWGRKLKGTNNPFNQKLLNGGWANYPSLDDAWQEWAKQWGPRAANLGNDAQGFARNLQLDNRNVYGPTVSGDHHGAYDPDRQEKEQWPESVLKSIESVRRRLPRWQGNLDALP
jgi:hypothetical protein